MFDNSIKTDFVRSNSEKQLKHEPVQLIKPKNSDVFGVADSKF